MSTTKLSSQQVRNKVATGSRWLLAMRLSSRLVGLLSIAIVARILSPADFGLVALASSLVAGIAIFGELGFDLYIIQKDRVNRALYSTAFTLTLIRGVIIAVTMTVLAWPLSDWFNQPNLIPILLPLAALAIVESLENPGVIEYRKELSFKVEFLLGVLPRLAGAAANISLAWWWESVYALVAGLAMQRLLRVLLSYVLHPYRPTFSIEGAGQMLKFSKWLLGSSLLRFGVEKAPIFILAKLHGNAIVGLYEAAKELADLAVTEVVQPIAKALFPGLVKLRDDLPDFRRTLVDVFSLLLLLCLPITVGLAGVADLIVPIVFGPQWLEAIAHLHILAWAGSITLGFAFGGNVMVALGKPRYNLMLNGLQLLVLLLSAVLLTPALGSMSVVWGLLISTLARLILIHSLFWRLLGLSAWHTLNRCWRVLCACVLMWLLVNAYSTPMAMDSSWLALVTELGKRVAIGGSSYVLVILLLWLLQGRPAGAEATVLQGLGARLKSEPENARSKNGASSTQD